MTLFKEEGIESNMSITNISEVPQNCIRPFTGFIPTHAITTENVDGSFSKGAIAIALTGELDELKSLDKPSNEYQCIDAIIAIFLSYSLHQCPPIIPVDVIIKFMGENND